MSLDDKTLKNIKKKVDLKQLKKLFKDKVPKDFLEKRFKKKDDEPLSPEEEKRLKKFLDKFKDKNKRIPKLTPEEREEFKKYGEKFKEKKKIIPIPKEDFRGKRFNPDKIPLDPRGEPFKLPERFKPGERGNKKFYDNMPYIIKPGEERPPSVQLLKKGGEVKRYKAGGSVKKNKSNMITTKGWGASRKT